MTIYDAKRDGKPVNPGTALYDYWFSILTGALPDERNDQGVRKGSLTFGNGASWGLSFLTDGPKDRPHISFGGNFRINKQGWFQVNSPWGWQQRTIISRNTFLRWGYFRGYNWTVDTTTEGNGARFDLFREPLHYVNEWTMGARGWWDRPWSKVEWSDQHGWHIAFASHKAPRPSNTYYAATWRRVTQEDFDKFERLRQRRYRLLERDYLIATGVQMPADREVLTEEERSQRREETLQAIIAHLHVGMPARTVSLRRDRKEEARGYPMDSHDPHGAEVLAPE